MRLDLDHSTGPPYATMVVTLRSPVFLLIGGCVCLILRCHGISGVFMWGVTICFGTWPKIGSGKIDRKSARLLVRAVGKLSNVAATQIRQRVHLLCYI